MKIISKKLDIDPKLSYQQKKSGIIERIDALLEHQHQGEVKKEKEDLLQKYEEFLLYIC